LVCKNWRTLIREKSKRLPYRIITTLKLIEKGQMILLSAATQNVTKKYSFPTQVMDEWTDVFTKMKHLLRHAIVKRWIVCNVSVNDQFATGLRSCLNGLPIEFHRLEMLAVNMSHISPDVFHRLMGQTIVAQQYFIDGVRNALEEHFSTEFIEQRAIRNADDFTVYDVRTFNNDEVILGIGDDALLDFIFGTSETPLRNSLYLDSPNVSSTFLKQFLVRY
jgi:hypothetical protein